MRISKISKGAISIFLLSYLTVTTVSLAKRTSSLTSSFVAGAKSAAFNKRLHTPRLSQKFVEDVVVYTGPHSEFSSPPAETRVTLASSKQFINGPKASTPSRAPPALL
jgi:hypothetical protein